MQPSIEPSRHARFSIDRRKVPAFQRELARDVREGFAATPKSLPPKYFYDATGSELFEQICETDEYYPTRSETGLLESCALELVETLRPRSIVELGSGSARKVRMILGAAERARLGCRYVPFDVSESMLRSAGEELLEDFPWLEVQGIVADYERDLGSIPAHSPALYMFLGGTIGNLDHAHAVRFLTSLANSMSREDRLLLGTDLVKPTPLLDRAYNDARGITARFNKNVLSVINRELGGRFNPEQFRHVAFFNEEKHQIEMHLESRRDQSVRIDSLELEVSFSEGERILTEVSRKFTKRSVEAMLSAAGLELETWWVSEDDYFALSLSGLGQPRATR